MVRRMHHLRAWKAWRAKLNTMYPLKMENNAGAAHIVDHIVTGGLHDLSMATGVYTIILKLRLHTSLLGELFRSRSVISSSKRALILASFSALSKRQR